MAKFDNSDGHLLCITTLGGNEATQLGNEELGFGVAVSGSGRVYVTGRVTSPDFTTTDYAVNPDYNGGRDAFFAVLDPTLTTLLYSTYLGGSGSETGRGIAVDEDGEIYSTGACGSDDFPTANPYQSSRPGSVGCTWGSKLTSSGSTLVFSTFLGGSNNDNSKHIAIDNEKRCE